MWSSQSFNDQMTGYYGNSLDYQSNLMNVGNANIYSNTTLKQSSPILNTMSHSPPSEDESSIKKKRRGQRNYRKVVIEKRRRDRINYSLDELRKLVPAANEKQGSAKLEKAEILQMTVDHLKGLHSKGFDAFSFDPHKFAMEYHAIGFRECVNEVARFLSNEERFSFEDPLKLRLVAHLQRYLAQREYNLKACSNLHSVWNPSVFIVPSSTSTTTVSSNVISMNNNCISPVSTPSNHSNSSSGASNSTLNVNTNSNNTNNNNNNNNNNNANYQQLNNSSANNSSTPTSPLCSSPISNGSLHNLVHSPYTDNNNNTSSNQNNENTNVNNTNNELSNESIRTNLDNNSLLSGMMPPPPPPPPTLIQKVTILNNSSPVHPSCTEPLSYTNIHSANPNYTSVAAVAAVHHHTNTHHPHHPHHHFSPIKMDSTQLVQANSYAPTTHSHHHHYAAAAAAAAVQQNHHGHPHHQYFNSALAYSSSVGQAVTNSMTNSGIVTGVPLTNGTVLSPANSSSSQHNNSAKYCRPWGAEMAC